MSTDIVVTGHRDSSGSFSLYYIDPTSGAWHQVNVDSTGSVTDSVVSNPPPTMTDDPNDASDTVKIEITNEAYRAEAMKAAANVLAGIEKIKQGFSDEDPNRVIVVNGRTTTIGAELNHLKNTEFVITDEVYNNGGGGEAIYNRDGGHNRVELNFDYFDGDSLDYASPVYENMEGLVGILLHELGHATQQGSIFNEDSHLFLNRQNARDKTTDSFVGSVYWYNNEAFANSYSRDIANEVDLDIQGWNPDEGFYYVHPSEIFFGSGIDLSADPQQGLIDGWTRYQGEILI